jgi:Bardet-Biedl syndrome 9 protein
LFLPISFKKNLSTDKIIVGSFMGYLRIFNPHPVKTGDEAQAEDLLLEVHLRDPILQVEVGKFVS